MSPRLQVIARGMSDRGLVRASNQDAFWLDTGKGLFMVADGMGGHAGGEVAASMATREVSAFLDRYDLHLSVTTKTLAHPDAGLLRAMSDAINTASTRIYEKALENPSLRGMGTTTTAVKIVDDHAYWGHVGDSRLYLLRCGFIYQLTHDHSLVGEQVEAGLLSEEEAKHHHLRNVITRSVGFQEEEYVDTQSLALYEGDYLLLCSDGLSNKLHQREMAQRVYQQDIDAVHTLVDLAKERGGEDNITIVLLRVQPGNYISYG